MKKITSILLSFIISLSMAGGAFAREYDNISVSKDNTCLVDTKSYDQGDQRCGWYLVNFIHLFEDWEGVVNDTLSASMKKIKNDQARKDKVAREANRNRIRIIQSPNYNK